MIHISLEKERVTVEGHAAYAAYGADIVCAAASALLQALAELLQEKNLVKELVMRPGFMSVYAVGAEKELALVKCGLRQLHRRYPKHVQVEER